MGALDSEIREYEATEAQLAKLSTYRTGAKTVKAAYQNIESMEKAILLREKCKTDFGGDCLPQTAAYHRWLYIG